MREEMLIAEILQDKNLGAEVSSELALYLTAQARYINALAERKELEVELIKNPPPKEEPIKRKKTPKREDTDMPW